MSTRWVQPREAYLFSAINFSAEMASKNHAFLYQTEETFANDRMSSWFEKNGCDDVLTECRHGLRRTVVMMY